MPHYRYCQAHLFETFTGGRRYNSREVVLYRTLLLFNTIFLRMFEGRKSRLLFMTCALVLVGSRKQRCWASCYVIACYQVLVYRTTSREVHCTALHLPCSTDVGSSKTLRWRESFRESDGQILVFSSRTLQDRGSTSYY